MAAPRHFKPWAWYSVDEALPQHTRTVLAMEGQRPVLAFYRAEAMRLHFDKGWYLDNGYGSTSITHWCEIEYPNEQRHPR